MSEETRESIARAADMEAAMQDILQEIATVANQLDSAVLDAVHDGSNNAFRILGKSIHASIQKIGWAADKGLGLVDGTRSGTVKGDAEDWLLPPFYSEPEEDS